MEKNNGKSTANGYGINLKIAVIFIGNISGKNIGKTIGTYMEKITEKAL